MSSLENEEWRHFFMEQILVRNEEQGDSQAYLLEKNLYDLGGGAFNYTQLANKWNVYVRRNRRQVIFFGFLPLVCLFAVSFLATKAIIEALDSSEDYCSKDHVIDSYESFLEFSALGCTSIVSLTITGEHNNGSAFDVSSVDDSLQRLDLTNRPVWFLEFETLIYVQKSVVFSYITDIYNKSVHVAFLALVYAGSILVENMTAINTLKMPYLTSVAYDFQVINSKTDSLSFNTLQKIGQSFKIEKSQVSELYFPWLRESNYFIIQHSLVNHIIFPNYTTTSSLTIYKCQSLKDSEIASNSTTEYPFDIKFDAMKSCSSIVIRSNILIRYITFAELLTSQSFNIIDNIIYSNKTTGRPNIKKVDLDNLKVAGNLEVSGNIGVTQIILPNLEKIDIILTILNDPQLLMVDFPVLMSSTSIIVDFNIALETMNFPALERISQDFQLVLNTKIKTAFFPKLVFSDSIIVAFNAALETLEFPLLGSSGLYLLSNQRFTSISVTKLVNSSSVVISENPLLNEVNLPSLIEVKDQNNLWFPASAAWILSFVIPLWREILRDNLAPMYIIENDKIIKINAPKLNLVNGNITIGNNTALATINFCNINMNFIYIHIDVPVTCNGVPVSGL